MELDQLEIAASDIPDDLLALDEALTQSRRWSIRQAAELVKLRYFAGLTGRAGRRGSRHLATNGRPLWAFARAWLLQKIQGGGFPSAPGDRTTFEFVRVLCAFRRRNSHCLSEDNDVGGDRAMTDRELVHCRQCNLRSTSAEARRRTCDDACGDDPAAAATSRSPARVPTRGRELPRIPAALRLPPRRPPASSTELPGHGHRPVQAAAADRRGGHGHGLHGRADPAGAADGRAEAHQGRHGQPPGPRPLRGRTPGAGPDGPPQHRQGPRRRHHRHGPPLLRDGAGQGHPDHQVLRRAPADAPRAARAGHPGLPGRAARPPEGDHPPRPQALQRPDRALRRQAGAQGHRLRRGQGDRSAVDRPDAVHRVRRGRRHARVHEPRAGGAEPARHRHPQRHLQPGRAALRALDRLDPAGAQAAEAGGVSGNAAGDPRGGVAAAEHAALDDRGAADRSRRAGTSSRGS